MTLIHRVLKILADGQRHSGVALAERLGVTRAAISKAVAGLSEVPVAVDRKGYSLARAFWPLDRERIQGLLAEAGFWPEQLTILEEVDSTNRFLLEAEAVGLSVCLAERQTAGRGRRGRSWQATPYGNLMVSVSTTLQDMPDPLGVLSLGAGVAVHRALRGLGIADCALKWPNDVLWQARKLAGILIEMRGEPEAMRIVIGVGLNGTVGPQAASAIDQPWVDLHALLPVVDRDQVAAAVIAELMRVMDEYRQGRGALLLSEWRAHHAYVGLRVSVATGREPPYVGTVQDVNAEGALVVQGAGGTKVMRSGEVSVRPL